MNRREERGGELLKSGSEGRRMKVSSTAFDEGGILSPRFKKNGGF
jgi:hypothetical protein